MNQVQLIVWSLLNGLTYGGWVTFFVEMHLAVQTNQTLPSLYINERFYLSTYLICLLYIILKKPLCMLIQRQTSSNETVGCWSLTPSGLVLGSLIPLVQIVGTQWSLAWFGIQDPYVTQRILYAIPSGCIGTFLLEHMGVHDSFRSWTGANIFGE